MPKDNPLMTTQDTLDGKTVIWIEGVGQFRLPKKSADQLARMILFGPEA